MANDMQSLDLTIAEVMEYTGWSFEMANDYVSRATDYMIVGSGSPEGVTPSNRTRQYFDAVSSQLYVNPVIGARDGWVMV